MCAVFHRLSSPIRRLTILYIVALSVIALLAIMGQILVQGALQQTSDDALIVNVAGQQRMLSQKISKAALAIEMSVITKDDASRQHYVEELRSALTLWRQAHKRLHDGDANPGISQKNSPTVMQLFATLEPHYRSIYNASSTLLACIHAPSPPSRAMIATAVQSILTEEPTYLTIMNTIVAQYQHEAEERIAHLQGIEYILLGITLGTLSLEGFFVFRPAIERIRQALAEQTEAKQQLAISYEEQRQLNHLKDQMLLNVNHELRTLMTSVYGYLELLRDHSGRLDPSTQTLFFDNAIQGCEEFQVHVNTVLSTLKVGNHTRPLAIERLHVAKVVTTVLDLFEPTKKHDHTIQLTLPETLTVSADQQSLYQVLRNLLSNAFKYSPQGTSITIGASLHLQGRVLKQTRTGASTTPGEVLHLQEQQQESVIRITVKDEGHGIPASEIPLLFNRFVRLQRDLNSTVDGSGLGLYISKQLIEAMRGRIWVESTGVDGEGCCFFIELPAAPPLPQKQDDVLPQMPVGV